MKILELFLLTNRVALVTGGRRGIGRAIAMALAEAGADIAVCDHADENGELEKLTADLKKMGRKCLTVRTDVSKSEQVQAMVKEVLEAYGKIDILVNNAGIGGEAAIPDLKEADWNAVIDTHLKGAYLCVQAVSAAMIAQKSGSIINIASVEGLTAAVRHASNAYPVAKAGIIMLTRGLAWDLGKHKIRVNAIAPGFVKTEMTRARWDEESPVFKQWTTELQAQLGAQPGADSLTNLRKWLMATIIPLERFAEPEEIAAGALYLASDAASYVSGHTLIMDGGMLA